MLQYAESLNDIVISLPLSKIGSFVFRVLSLQWVTSVTSPEGARIHGARFNPPATLAEAHYGVKNGFGLLYTATDPITCLFEAKHVLRGLSPTEHQILAVPPSVTITFLIESDSVLDLRDVSNQRRLGITAQDLTALDQRYRLNPKGELTNLQRLGAAVYQTERFDGILTPSRFSDIVPSYCFNFFPERLQPVVVDPESVLSKVTVRAPRKIASHRSIRSKVSVTEGSHGTLG